MSALPVARYLTELGPGQGGAREAGGRSEVARKAEVEQLIEVASARAAAESGAKARAELDSKLAEQAAAAERTLSEERRRWVSEEGERLSGQIVAALGDLEARIAGQIARIMSPMLVTLAERRALSDLVEAVDGLLSKGDVAKVTVSGPPDLLEKMRAHLDGRIANASFEPAADCDLRVTADQTILETQIGAWVRAIEGARP